MGLAMPEMDVPKMREYKLELTEIEVACGVTLEQVAEVLPKVLMRNNACIIPGDVGPALAGAVARCAFAEPAEFLAMNGLGQSIYVPREG